LVSKGVRCLFFFILALVFDIGGLVIFLLGIFASFTFWEFFVLTGPIIIFLSLIFWIFWYLGNITACLLPKNRQSRLNHVNLGHQLCYSKPLS
uniref:Transmembrane protein 238 like n=1 Tax=Paramormyrops kingsleyae TaxID=1676925 RepID=A0A3B3SH56_9TELE